MIINCKDGKIIISGVGKSGRIGKKWAATFSSTGTPAFFLDASSASHGIWVKLHQKILLY